tara:strand:+ start:178 stop:441 length:264 start_codon:yes stop_codon:yes gene_type:complete
MINSGNKKRLTGKVLDSKMQDTTVVEVSRRFSHPLYKKYITKTKKYYAHDPNNNCMAGDIVNIVESKPMSKLKRWRVVSVVTQNTKG